MESSCIKFYNSLITKPYRIRLKPGRVHTLINPLTNKGIQFKEGTEFWCAKAYSQDHSTYKSLFLFNHTFYTTFALGSKTLMNKWEVVESDKDWKNDMSVLQTEHLALNIFIDGSVPEFVPKEQII